MSDATVAPPDSQEPLEHDAPTREPSGEGRPKVVERPAWHVGILIAIPTVLITAFVVATWTVEPFREAMGVLGPYVPVSLYAAVGVLLVAAAARRVLGARIGTRGRAPTPLLNVLAGPLALSGAVLAYLVSIVDNWESARRSYSTIAGVVPWSDAHNYYFGAETLLFNGHLDAWNSRRPLNAAFLADRLAITNLDLRSTLVIQAILLGVACYLAARAISRDFGLIAGLALFAGIYGFASFGVETTLSESLGVTLGALAFAALWTAVRERRVWLSVAGLFLLTFAFNARAGTVMLFLVLPLFFARYFRGGKRINVRVLGVGVAAILAALGANLLLVVMLGGSPGSVNGNLYSVLYGLAKGNQGWEAVYRDYPQLNQTPEDEADRFIREKAITEVRQHPGTFAKGLARSAGDYLQQTRDQVMGPVDQRPLRLLVYAGAALGAFIALLSRWRTSRWRVLVDIALFGGLVLAVPVLFGVWGNKLWVGGLGSYFVEWLPLIVVATGYVAFVVWGTDHLHSPGWSFEAVSLVGIAASLPLVPINDSGSVRAYAATLPFLALSFAGAVAILARVIAGLRVRTPSLPRRPYERWWPVAVGGSIVAVALLGTPVAMATVSKPEVRPRTCPDGRPAKAFLGGVAVHLDGNAPRAEGELDELDLAHFSPTTVEIAGSLREVGTGTTILQALPVRGSNQDITLTVVDGHVDPPGRSVLYLCGQKRVDPTSKLPVFFGKPLGHR